MLRKKVAVVCIAAITASLVSGCIFSSQSDRDDAEARRFAEFQKLLNKIEDSHNQSHQTYLDINKKTTEVEKMASQVNEPSKGTAVARKEGVLILIAGMYQMELNEILTNIKKLPIKQQYKLPFYVEFANYYNKVKDVLELDISALEYIELYYSSDKKIFELGSSNQTSSSLMDKEVAKLNSLVDKKKKALNKQKQAHLNAAKSKQKLVNLLSDEGY